MYVLIIKAQISGEFHMRSALKDYIAKAHGILRVLYVMVQITFNDIETDFQFINLALKPYKFQIQYRFPGEMYYCCRCS